MDTAKQVQLSIRIDDELRKQVKVCAVMNNITETELVTKAINEYLTKLDKV